MSDHRDQMPPPPPFIPAEDWGLWGQVCHYVKAYTSQAFTDKEMTSLAVTKEDKKKAHRYALYADHWYRDGPALYQRMMEWESSKPAVRPNLQS